MHPIDSTQKLHLVTGLEIIKLGILYYLTSAITFCRGLLRELFTLLLWMPDKFAFHFSSAHELWFCCLQLAKFLEIVQSFNCLLDWTLVFLLVFAMQSVHRSLLDLSFVLVHLGERNAASSSNKIKFYLSLSLKASSSL